MRPRRRGRRKRRNRLRFRRALQAPQGTAAKRARPRAGRRSRAPARGQPRRCLPGPSQSRKRVGHSSL
eukprot:1695013-Pyramimonas_sp.AAC.1